MSSNRLFGDWDKAIKLLDSSRVKKGISIASKRAALFTRDEVRRGIRGQAPGGKSFKPLSTATIAAKGSSKALVNHGDLIGGITYELPDEKTAVIGVKKSAKSKDGESLVNIARVHEYGVVINVTPKMRGFLSYKGIHLKSSTKYIKIPERSFLRATRDSEVFQKSLQDVYLKALQEVFKL